MKLAAILEKYETILLDQISSDKIDETISLRLPRPVIIQEIVTALSSLSYISEKIGYAKPPTYAILDLILHSPDYIVAVEGFREKVLVHVETLTAKTEQFKNISRSKNYELYFKILRRAWETDGAIDKSESGILELVKSELGIWDREHFVLAHHPSILKLWDIEQEYSLARNILLSTGIVLTEGSSYLIAEEVAIQIKKTLGMELTDVDFLRLLNGFIKEDLVTALTYFQLNISGSKDEQVARLMNALIPPAELLDVLTIDALRELCRQNSVQVSGSKNTVISNIVQHFDLKKDLATEEEGEETETVIPSEPEQRELDRNLFSRILLNLTHQELYDVLYQSQLATSGSKEEKVARLLNSPWSERSLLNHLRKEDLSQLCRKFNVPVSGSKQQLIDRLLDLDLVTIVNPPVSIIVPSEVVVPAEPKIETAVENSPVSLPVNFAAIEAEFPDLEHDEKIVVSILKEAKSLTEQELERVVIKHRLKWFLHKAQMVEIIARLKRAGKNLIRIKSVNNNNIYQWIEGEKSEATIEKKSARDIIDALRNGVVPKHNLNLLMVGQQNARNHLEGIMQELNFNKSYFKFIRGEYGSGKTFLCSWLKEHALENEYTVSFINISHDQPLSDLPVFFSGVINGLRTPEKTDSSALVDILESWLLNIHTKTARIEGASSHEIGTSSNLAAIVEKNIETELSKLNDIEPGFSPVLRAFYKGKASGNVTLASNALAWITGSRSLSGHTLREIGVKGYLDGNNVFPRMRAILELIGGARYKGLLLLVDELELVRKFPHLRQREQALETLRLLIDETGKNGLPACFVVFTGTDEFFDDERYGLKSYQALADRVLTPLQHGGFVSMRQPIISLETLDKERLANVIFKIRDLYGLAYNWDAKVFADDASISQLIDNWTIFGDENINRKPRPVLRELIQILDICEENKGLTVADFLRKRQLESGTMLDSLAN